MHDFCPFCQNPLLWCPTVRQFVCQAPTARDCGVGFIAEVDGSLHCATLNDDRSFHAKNACFTKLFQMWRQQDENRKSELLT